MTKRNTGKEEFLNYVGFNNISLYINKQSKYLVVREEFIDNNPSLSYLLLDYEEVELRGLKYLDITIDWKKVSKYTTYGDVDNFLDSIKGYFGVNLILNIKDTYSKEFIKYLTDNYNPYMTDIDGNVTNGFLAESNNTKKVILFLK